jgi:hypothetical protein
MSSLREDVAGQEEAEVLANCSLLTRWAVFRLWKGVSFEQAC